VAEHVSRERVNRDEANRKKANFQPDPAVPVQFSAHNKGKIPYFRVTNKGRSHSQSQDIMY
jgi:hypothetical protein